MSQENLTRPSRPNRTFEHKVALVSSIGELFAKFDNVSSVPASKQAI